MGHVVTRKVEFAGARGMQKKIVCGLGDMTLVITILGPRAPHQHWLCYDVFRSGGALISLFALARNGFRASRIWLVVAAKKANRSYGSWAISTTTVHFARKDLLGSLQLRPNFFPPAPSFCLWGVPQTSTCAPTNRRAQAP